MKRRTGSELAAIAAARLMQGPATLRDVRDAMCISRQASEVPARYVRSFKACGLVYVAQWYRGCYPMYQWQPAPFALQDAPKPPKAPKYRPRAVVAIPTRPASAFTWGRA